MLRVTEKQGSTFGALPYSFCYDVTNRRDPPCISAAPAALEDPAAYQAGRNAIAINRDLSAVAAQLVRLTTEWESVTATVSAP